MQRVETYGWRWAPAWVLAFVALWPAPGYAEAVLALGAVAGIARLLLSRFRGGTALLSGPAWALTTVLFFAYWLPEAISALDAADRARAAWLTYALVLSWTGLRLLGWKRLLGVFAFGALLLAFAAVVSPAVAERLQRSTTALSGGAEGVDHALSGRSRIWSAAVCMARTHPVNGVGARGFRDAFPACDAADGEIAAWGIGPALHAHQIVLEVLSETGTLGLLLWLAGAALAWRAWHYGDAMARDRARPAMLALAATVFPLNTHLAAYSTFWGGVLLLLAALYAGSLLGREPA